MPGHNGSLCLPSNKPNNLFQGVSTPAQCISKCASIAACEYATIEFFPPTRPGGGYCTLFAHCASIGGWDSTPCTLPAPHINSCVPQNNVTAHIATYKRPANLPGAPPVYGKYVLETPFAIVPVRNRPISPKSTFGMTMTMYQDRLGTKVDSFKREGPFSAGCNVLCDDHSVCWADNSDGQ